MYQSLFDMFKNEHLTPAMRAVKFVGQLCLVVAAIGVAAIQLNGGKLTDDPFMSVMSGFAGIGFMAGIVCFAIVGLFALGKGNGTSKTHSALGKGFAKIFLYIYLPAIIGTIILTVLFVLPRYQ